MSRLLGNVAPELLDLRANGRGGGPCGCGELILIVELERLRAIELGALLGNHLQAGETIDVGCLTLGNARVLHMPGELFVEYQLAAQELRPDLFVCMAAYGEYAPWYIGTDIAYEEGGYETSEGASLVGPGSEAALVGAMRTLLEAENVPLAPLGAAAHEREVRAIQNP